MRIEKEIDILTNYYDLLTRLINEQIKSEEVRIDFQILIKDCKARIEQIKYLLVLENSLLNNFEEVVNKQQDKQKEQLIEADKSSPQDKKDYIISYYNEYPTILKNTITKGEIKDDNDVVIDDKSLVFYILTEYATNFILYDKETSVFYYGNIQSSQPGKNAYYYYNIQGIVDDELKEPYLTLLKGLYIQILFSQQNTTSASNTSISSPLASIVQPPISQELKENSSKIKKAGINVLTGLKNFVSNLINHKSSTTASSTGGSKKTTYKLNGEKVVLLHKNKKVQRSIYVKGNGKTKYCKIDKEYVLLSKVKNKIQ